MVSERQQSTQDMSAALATHTPQVPILMILVMRLPARLAEPCRHIKPMSLSSNGCLRLLSCVSLTGYLSRVFASSKVHVFKQQRMSASIACSQSQVPSLTILSRSSLPGSISVMFSTPSQVPILTILSRSSLPGSISVMFSTPSQVPILTILSRSSLPGSVELDFVNYFKLCMIDL